MSDIKPAVVGVGTTTFGKLPGHTAADLGAWALTEALADAGISATDVDGLVTSRVGYESIAADMRLRPRWVSSLPAEGRMCGVAVHQAAAAIATGEAHTVALVYGNDGATARATYGGAGEAYGTATALTLPYGLTSPGAFYALMLQRHRHLYGTSEEQLATISMTFRGHARLNPNAVMRKPISLADYLTSRYVVEPMRLLDYCLINDGGVAMILTAGDRAHDHPKPPVHVLGIAQRAQLGNSDFPPEDFWAGAIREVGDRALAQADRIRNDIDALMIYDNFSCNVLFTLEGLGYCGIGEGGTFIQGDRLAVGGPLPTNTSGGHLSESYMQGWGISVEAIRQLRGECGDRQVHGARTIQYACASPVVSSVIYGMDA
ncbi:thiolase family protein [Rhodococcus opacus]|uniref:thiolase family protein n=1 Tax=Rhodococcus opacus TaxID=37919 RepID=UPI000EAABD88|nr:thiolase family protein [Rhodococcus opacus]QZS59519.1 thiolase family protein [Rhodococcus opacus]RKM73912.1 lipid-transfer protein [Rhodococcus opacus]